MEDNFLQIMLGYLSIDLSATNRNKPRKVLLYKKPIVERSHEDRKNNFINFMKESGSKSVEETGSL